MVAVDTATGAPVAVSGAALAGGPLLALSPGRRLQDLARLGPNASSLFPSLFRARAAVQPAYTPAVLASERRQPETLPARWGVPAFYDGAAGGPPYELDNRAAEWLLGVQAAREFAPADRQARMVSRAHPRGPALRHPPALLAALFQTPATPPHLGTGIDWDG